MVTPPRRLSRRAVLNVLTGERYKTIAKETAGISEGEYGHTPVPVNARRYRGPRAGKCCPVTCRPGEDLLKPELAELGSGRQAPGAGEEGGHYSGGNAIDDVLTVALFPQIGLKFLENRTTRRRLSRCRRRKPRPVAKRSLLPLPYLHRGSGR